MSVKRINFTIDEELYEKVRAISFLKKKSVSEIIRYSLINFMSKDNLKVKAEELLSAEEESISNAKKELEKIAASIPKTISVKMDVTVGFPNESIRAYSLANDIDLILVGGSTAEYRFIPKGMSTALSLLSESSCPVMLIPKSWNNAWNNPSLKIQLADDLSANSEAAVHSTVALATLLKGASINHCHVNPLSKEILGNAMSGAFAASHTPKGAIKADEIWDLAMSKLMKKLVARTSEFKERMEQHNTSIRHTILQGEPLGSLLDLAHKENPDLLAFGRHRAWHKDSMSLGNIPFHSMLKSGKPVIVVG